MHHHPSRTGPAPPRDVLLNVDLLGLTPVYITHLDRWRPFYHGAADESFVRRLVQRYEHLWLPLLFKWQQLDLEPPADIHWIWQLHLLQPNHYAGYCREKFGRVLPHRIRKYDRESATALQRTASLWRDTYPGTSFEADLDHLRSSSGIGTGGGDAQRNGTKLGDLVEVALNELEFLYQIGLSHYRDQSFQYAAVERYKRLLYFKSLRPTERLRLPVDIQLVWRVHLLHPIQYAEDTRRIFGSPVYALGPMDFEAHFLLIAESNNAWREAFGEELFLDGTGYRGHESAGRAMIHGFPRENYDRRAIESCEISLDRLTVEEIWTKEKRIIVEAKLLGENSFAQETVFRTQGTVGSAMGGDGPGSARVSGDGGANPVGRTHFDTRRNKGIEFHVLGRRGLGCISREHTVATKLFNPVQYFQNLPSLAGGTQLVVLPKVTYTDPKISFEMTVKAAAPKPHVFTLDRNPSEPGPLPLDFRHFATSLQPWAVAMATPGDNQFQHARHSLKCREAGIAFGVEVIRHDPSNLGAVLLYHNNQRLVCVAYSIDTCELPSHNQVLETCPVAFDQHEGDHAILIRNHLGDYAICIARWRGSSAVSGDGRVVIRSHFLQTRLSQTLEVRDDELQTIQSESVSIDLPTGRLSIDSSCDFLPEQVTWAFSVGILFLLSQRSSVPSSFSTGSVRSGQWSSTASEPELDLIGGASVTKRSKFSAKAHINQKKLAKRRKMSASFTFLLACGLQIDATLYGTTSRPSSRGSPAANRPAITPNGFVTPAAPSDDVTFARPAHAQSQAVAVNGVTQYTPNGLKNADPGLYAFQQLGVQSGSVQRQSNRQAAPPTQLVAPRGEAEYYADVRL